MSDSGIRTIFALLLGFMLIVAGLHGNFGSMLAALIDTQSLTQAAPPGGGF